MNRAALALIALTVAGCETGMVRVTAESMEPTYSAGDVVHTVPFRDVADLVHGRVITYEYVGDFPGTESGEIFFFRIVGLPGDQLTHLDETLVRNGQVVSEPYASYALPPEAAPEAFPLPQSEFEGFRVPDGHVFVLGDNRYNALDSRYHGPVPLERVQRYVPE